MNRRGFIAGLSALAVVPVMVSALPKTDQQPEPKDLKQMTVGVRVDNEFVVKAFIDDYNKNGKTRQAITREQG